MQTKPNFGSFLGREYPHLLINRETHRQIMATSDPREQKALGRKVRGFDPALWDKEGYDVVVEGNLAKFRQNPCFRDQLLATGDRVRVYVFGVVSVFCLVVFGCFWLFYAACSPCVMSSCVCVE